MSEENYLGQIEVSPRAIAGIAGRAVLESYGVVGMAPSHKSFRDGIAEILPGSRYRRGIEVTLVDHEITIDLYVVIQYGTRISEVTHGIVNRVKFSVEKALGMPIKQVNVHVQGLHVEGKSS
jgi:uncharacterized alkaline shock family protein YloU